MTRRALLVWFSRVVYAAAAAAVAAPVAWFLGASQRRTENKDLRQRIARLSELPTGDPQLLSVIGTRQNAWTRHTDETVGRVWVVRQTPTNLPADRTKLSVFNVTCPHSGCPVGIAAQQKGFHCNCHGADFHLDGSRVTDIEGYVNPSPRGLDPLPYELVKDEATGESWVVIEYKSFELGIADRVERT